MMHPAPPQPPKRKRWSRRLFGIVGWIGVFVVASLAMARCQTPTLPHQAPDFALATLDGGTVRLADLRGKTVVLNFWATWCGPCRVEIPTFSAFAKDHPEIAVLGIATDGTAPSLRAARDKLGITYPILLADPETLRRYKIRGIPHTVVINPDGTVRTNHVGVLFRPQLWWMTR
jgi:thiol-disulfide isomerase/thioredoxin